MKSYCDWSVSTNLDGGMHMNDVEDSIHLSPGTKVKYYHPSLTASHHKIMVTKKVTIVKEFPLYFIVDFGNYLSTIHKIDLLIGEAKLEIK